MQFTTRILSRLFAGGIITSLCFAAEHEEAKPEAIALAIVKKTIETELTTSEEKRDWKNQEALLQELIKLYETELTLINEELEASGDITENLDSTAEDLKTKTAELERQRKEIHKRSKAQAERLLTITKRFPQPLQEEIATDEAVLVSRESNVRDIITSMISILKSASQFNRTVNYSNLIEEVEGKKRQMRVLYLGLGQAYYISGDTAGIGKPVDGKWSWTEIPDSKANIDKAIAVYQKTRRPELIKLPVQR